MYLWTPFRISAFVYLLTTHVSSAYAKRRRAIAATYLHVLHIGPDKLQALLGSPMHVIAHGITFSHILRVCRVRYVGMRYVTEICLAKVKCVLM